MKDEKSITQTQRIILEILMEKKEITMKDLIDEVMRRKLIEDQMSDMK